MGVIINEGSKKLKMESQPSDQLSSSSPNKKHEWFRLTKKRARIILLFLFIIMIGSGTMTTCLMIAEINPFKYLSITSLSIIGGLASSFLGSSIYYSRKLYKACINQDMLTPESENDFVRQLGVTYYYLMRPFYSACLSLIATIALRSGAEFITTNGSINDKFPYLTMLICFFVGYSSSDLIDDLESRGKKVVSGIINVENKPLH